jgi:hypothetical protein
VLNCEWWLDLQPIGVGAAASLGSSRELPSKTAGAGCSTALHSDQQLQLACITAAVEVEWLRPIEAAQQSAWVAVLSSVLYCCSDSSFAAL